MKTPLKNLAKAIALVNSAKPILGKRSVEVVWHHNPTESSARLRLAAANKLAIIRELIILANTPTKALCKHLIHKINRCPLMRFRFIFDFRSFCKIFAP